MTVQKKAIRHRSEMYLAVLQVCRRSAVNCSTIKQKANLNAHYVQLICSELSALGYIRIVDRGLVAYKGSSHRFYVATDAGRAFLDENVSLLL